mmetsp:Transcript_9230/g.19901  ORF Transcript_9230/g.19901 Transcript_9230/m.19901 type:complete len:210 (+) Transcript_9230:283-912(+)
MPAGCHDRIDKGLAAQKAGKRKIAIARFISVAGVTVVVARLGAFSIHKFSQLSFFLLFLLFLLLFPLLFELPSRQRVSTIVQINAGISITAKARLFVVFTNIGLVVKPRRDSNILTGLDGTGQKFVAGRIAINSIRATTILLLLLFLLLHLLLGGQVQGPTSRQVGIGYGRGSLSRLGCCRVGGRHRSTNQRVVGRSLGRQHRRTAVGG